MSRAVLFSANAFTCDSIIKLSLWVFRGIAYCVCFSCRASMYRTHILTDGASIAAGRPYAERSEDNAGWHDRLAESLYGATLGPISNRIDRARGHMESIVALTEQYERELRQCGDADLRRRAQ